jgi:hexosaminidase
LTGKSVRIWGTFPPTANATSNVDQTVSIQHWEFFEDNPLFDYIDNGYDVLNSDDAHYIVGKWSGSYAQQLNLSRIFHGAPDGGAYAPNIFDRTNATNNPARSDARVLGQVAAQWNDYGPNATVYSEAYYAWRDGLPALADKQWGGALLEPDYARIFAVLHAAVPGQNLDRTIPSRGATIVAYDFAAAAADPLADLSGNGYDAVAVAGCQADDMVAGAGLRLTAGGCVVETPLGSKGRNYTLSFSIRPGAGSRGAVLTGPDSALWAGNGSSSAVMLVAGGNAFALNYTFPEGRWTNASLEARGPQTFLSVVDAEASGPETEMEFMTTLGINGAYFVWAPIAVEAPLRTIGGGGFEGELGYLQLTA